MSIFLLYECRIIQAGTKQPFRCHDFSLHDPGTRSWREPCCVGTSTTKLTELARRWSATDEAWRRGCGTSARTFVGTCRPTRSATGCSDRSMCSSVVRSAMWFVDRRCGLWDASFDRARTTTPSCLSAARARRSLSSATSYRWGVITDFAGKMMDEWLTAASLGLVSPGAAEWLTVVWETWFNHVSQQLERGDHRHRRPRTGEWSQPLQVRWWVIDSGVTRVGVTRDGNWWCHSLFSWKNWRPIFSHRSLESDDLTFLAVVFSPLPSSHFGYLVFFLNSATKK